MILYKTKMDKMPQSCLECGIDWCGLPLKANKYEPEMKVKYKKCRHENCPLISMNELTKEGDQE